MMVAKIAILGLFEIKIYCNKGYDVVIFVHEVTNKISSHDSNCITDVVI